MAMAMARDWPLMGRGRSLLWPKRSAGDFSQKDQPDQRSFFSPPSGQGSEAEDKEPGAKKALLKGREMSEPRL